LKDPAAAASLESTEDLAQLSLPGLPLLLKLIEVAREQPGISSGALLEHWRDTDDEPHLKRLLSLPIDLAPEGVKDEIQGAIAKLRTMLEGQERRRALYDRFGPSTVAAESPLTERLN
jgi:DNA primase